MYPARNTTIADLGACYTKIQLPYIEFVITQHSSENKQLTKHYMKQHNVILQQIIHLPAYILNIV